MPRASMVPVAEAARRVKAGEAVLLDVREPDELEIASVSGALALPMSQIVARVAEVPRGKPILVMCHHGYRSQQVANWLVGQGFDAQNVAGGIDAWSAEVDADVPRY